MPALLTGDRGEPLVLHVEEFGEAAAGGMELVGLALSVTTFGASVGRMGGSNHYILRAIRNAILLSELTDRPPHAVIAAGHIDNGIRDEIQSGDVHWYESGEHEFMPD